jgi:exodeoxyribonuclease III
MPFTLATWNINSVRLREGSGGPPDARREGRMSCAFRNAKAPSTRSRSKRFSLGYTHMVARGQKGYNGVAIMSKLPLEDAPDRWISPRWAMPATWPRGCRTGW